MRSFFNVSRLYLTLCAISAFAANLMFTTYAVYYIDVLHMNPFQMVLVGTVLEATMFFFEVPTGVVADVYSRRLSYIISCLILGGAFLLEGAIPYYAGLLKGLGLPLVAGVFVAEAIRGIGETFLSGAFDAWVTDEVGEERVGPLFMRAGQIGRIAGLLGIPAGVGLASLGLHLPYMAGGALLVMQGVIAILYMPEQGFKPTPAGDRPSYRVMWDTFKGGARLVRRSPVLLMLLVVSVAAGASSEGFDRLWEAHVLTTFGLPALGSLKPVTWFGIFGIAGSLIGILTSEVALRRIDLTNNRVLTRALLITTGLRIALIGAFAMAGSFAWGVTALLALGAVGALYYPLYSTWVNQNLDSNVRATVLSMMSQSNALGQTAGGPVVGAVASRRSLRAGLVLAAILLVPALGVYRRAQRNETSEAATELPS